MQAAKEHGSVVQGGTEAWRAGGSAGSAVVSGTGKRRAAFGDWRVRPYFGVPTQSTMEPQLPDVWNCIGVLDRRV